MLVQFLSFALLVYLFYKIRWHRAESMINKIPGPPISKIPWFGNTFDVFLLSLPQFWDIVRKWSDSYYPIMRFWSFENWMITIRHPDDVEILLTSTKQITKSQCYEFIQPWLGTGLLTSTGLKWKNRRKVLTPAFHFSILNEFVKVFGDQSQQLVDSIKESGELIHDLTPLLSKFTLHTICETAMGIKLQDEKKKRTIYHNAISDMGRMLFTRVMNPWLREKWIFPFTSLGRLQNRALEILHGFSNEIIEKRKEYHEENADIFLNYFGDNESEEETLNEGRNSEVKNKRVALLDLLIQVWKREEIDNDGIREEVDTFVFEGHDTTAAGMIFAVLLLAEHKDIQDRARKEVNEVFKKSGSRLNTADLQSLVYLDRCIKESLRLYPSVPQISRFLTEDLPLTNYIIPKDSELTVLIYDLHRDPCFWPEPEIYNPDRFLPERIRDRHPFSYIPFSAGPRNCIGQKFAMMELKSSIANLLHNFYFEPIDIASKARLTMDLVIRPVHPVRVKFIPIN